MQNNQDTNTMTLVSSKDFRTGVMPRAQLSMQASKLAVDKAVQKDTKEFAGWELMEAIAVINVLKDAGTPVSPMGEEGRAFLEKLKGLEGNDFDKEYMKAELSNHEFLRDLAQNYLDGTDEKSYGGEKETWHVAEELDEFRELIREEQPQSAVQWLTGYFDRMKVIYAFQLLSGALEGNNYDIVSTLRTAIWEKTGGILQADDEGFSNEERYHILWQYAETVTGDLYAAVQCKWRMGEIPHGLGDHFQRMAFQDGNVPQMAVRL